MKLYFSPILLLLIALLAGCNKFDQAELEQADDVFFVRNKGAEMPVWVRGNASSGVFIILNHGGPGSSGIFEVNMEAQPGNGQIDHESPLKELEEDYAMVYWDQRHSGNSQGKADPDETRLEDFGDDMELVINALKARHNVSKIFVIGQSWGHTVATTYLTLGDNWEHRQTKIDGYINYKGNISFNMAYQYTRPRLTQIAEERINDALEVDYWTDIKQFLAQNDRIETPEDAVKYFELADKAMDAEISTGQRIGTSVKYSFFSPHNGWYHWANSGNTNSSEFMEIFIQDDRLTETAHRIQVPTLLVYGRHDLIAPFEVGEWHLDAIETPGGQKELLILEDSRHGAEMEDIRIFQDALINFIESI